MPRGKGKKGQSSGFEQLSIRTDLEFYNLQIDDMEQWRRFTQLARVGVQVTKFASSDVEEVGIHGNVRALFDHLGWREAFYLDWKTNPRATLEFLSTLEVYEFKGRNSVPVSITFRLGNTNRELTADKLAEAFNVPHGGDTKSGPRCYTSDFWDAMMDSEYHEFRTDTTKPAFGIPCSGIYKMC